MSGWGEYALAWAFFLLSHALPVRPAVKGRVVLRIGNGGFGLVYSAVSILALGWLIVATGRAPFLPLWDWAAWQRPVAQVAMLGACLLIAFAALAPNPLSFGGWRNDRFDPARPGIVGLVRHPYLAALGSGPINHLEAAQAA